MEYRIKEIDPEKSSRFCLIQTDHIVSYIAHPEISFFYFLLLKYKKLARKGYYINVGHTK